MLIGLVAAIVIGLGVSRYVYKRVQQQAAAPPAPATTQMVVAKSHLSLGTRLQPQDLKLVAWPDGQRLPGSFARIEDCVNRAVVSSVVENEPILEGKLAPKESGAGLSAVIPEGMRAVSVRVDDVVAVAGFTMPGTTVDVQLTATPPGGNSGITNTILENVRVMTAGQQVEQDKDGKPKTVTVVTLLVSPEQANKLTMASTDGRIHLALRNTIDTKEVKPAPVHMASLLGAPVRTAPKVIAQHADSPFVVEVFRGDKRANATF
jgi:pilus assembly protein CpaB